MSSSTFDVLGIPLVEGRTYSDDENAGEVVINEAAATRLWPGQSALGHVLVRDGRAHTVVGVSRSVFFTSRGAIRPVLHMPAGALTSFPALIVRADGTATSDRLRALITGLDPAATVFVRSLSDAVASRLDDEAAGAQAAWAGGLLALMLATFGVFGVFAFVVEERRREVGIRVALGAQKAQVSAAMFRPARLAVMSGLGLGLVLSLGVGPVLGELGISLFGLSPFDPVAFATVGAILATAAFVATVIPVRRALRVDPAVILKEDA
jgi:hypothetical protein